MQTLKLYMLLLGCKPQGRHTEQHDIFFAIGISLQAIIPEILDFWPEAIGKIHIDAWREVTFVNDYSIKVIQKDNLTSKQEEKLFFLNLGGYQTGEFEEYHYKILCIEKKKSLAIDKAKNNMFYKQKRSSHIDDKYGIDVDDAYNVEEILPKHMKEKYALQIAPSTAAKVDIINIGYYKLSTL